MLSCRSAFLLLAALLAAAAQAGPVTANFDDIDASASDVPISSPYLGLNWTNFTAYTATPGFTGFNNGIVSPLNGAYSGGEIFGNTASPVVGSITSGTLFAFLGAQLGAGYYNGLSLTAQGLRSGTLVYSQTVSLNTAGAQAFAFDFMDIDTLLLSGAVTSATTDPFNCGGFNCTQFTLDDVRLITTDIVSPPPVNGVPEPGSVALVLTAGAALAYARRTVRRRQSVN